MTYQATADSTRTPYSRPIFGALYKRKKMEARLQAQAQREAIAMTNTATTDAMHAPYSPIPIVSDLYTRKMETEARQQAEAHNQAAMQRQQQEDAIHRQQAEARRQQSAAKWQAEAIRQQRQQQRR